VVVGLTAIGGALFWVFGAGRPALLVHGAVLATAVSWLRHLAVHHAVQRSLELQAFGGAVDRHAHGAEAAVFKYQSDEWMSLDFTRSSRSRSRRWRT